MQNYNFKYHDKTMILMHDNSRRTFHDRLTLSNIKKVKKNIDKQTKKGEYLAKKRNAQGDIIILGLGS